MRYPALDVSGADTDLLLAIVDDCGPTAVEEHPGSVTLFFSGTAPRDRARDRITHELPLADALPREVDDEDWARRSQESLGAVTVGGITVAPPWARPPSLPGGRRRDIVIQPSMGFGTGHHATTRLCLAGLQTLELSGACVLDVGTGSGVLAIAARRLGARRAIGLDTDADALEAAEANLALNPGAEVSLVQADVAAWLETPGFAALRDADPVDVVAANLTGALLTRIARLLVGAVRPGGAVIVSGLLDEERDAVIAAFPATVGWNATEDGWVGLRFDTAPRADGSAVR
jgi:ribosomal protein L11 methyltransferase